MPYDFDTLVDRTGTGSVKWNLMLEAVPDVPAGIVPLSIGDMEIKNPPELIEGLRQYIADAVLGYTEPTRQDTQAILDWFARRHSWEIEPEWLAGFDGIVPAMYQIVRAFSEPGDGVLFMPPVYRPFRDAIADNERTPVEVPLTEDADGYAMDFAALERAAAEPRNKILLFCSPHNPVSRVWRQEELERMGSICRDNGVLVVSDEIHMDFVMPGHRHLVFSEINPAFAANCIICTAPSKTFNMAGLQISNLVIPDATIRARFVEAYNRTGRFGVNQLGLAACRIAYERCEGWLDAVLRLIDDNARMVRTFMTDLYPEVRVHRHEGTYFQWLDFRAWKKPPEELERFFTREARLFLDEGYIFGKQGEGFERINLACPSWVLRDALERLQAAGRP